MPVYPSKDSTILSCLLSFITVPEACTVRTLRFNTYLQESIALCRASPGPLKPLKNNGTAAFSISNAAVLINVFFNVFL